MHVKEIASEVNWSVVEMSWSFTRCCFWKQKIFRIFLCLSGQNFNLVKIGILLWTYLTNKFVDLFRWIFSYIVRVLLWVLLLVILFDFISLTWSLRQNTQKLNLYLACRNNTLLLTQKTRIIWFLFILIVVITCWIILTVKLKFIYIRCTR